MNTSSVQLRVLIVEDDAANAEVLTLVLEMAGHRVTTAATAKEALVRAAADQPAVVLLDLGLPDEDGGNITVALRQSLPAGARIIITSGTSVDAAEARRLGVDGVLEKPFDPERLLAVLAGDRTFA
jgi:CheY-like chemotaxis protein